MYSIRMKDKDHLVKIMQCDNFARNKHFYSILFAHCAWHIMLLQYFQICVNDELWLLRAESFSQPSVKMTIQ